MTQNPTAPAPAASPADTGSPVMLAPGAGRSIVGGAVHATVKVTQDHPSYASTFEMEITPGFDVGAHIHLDGEEMFYVVSGQLDVMAFEPVDRSGDWHDWVSADGQRVLSGGPGAFMYVPPNVPHAFANSTDETTRIFFQSSIRGGHENYFVELADILAKAQGRPDGGQVAALQARYDTEQLTQMKPGKLS